MAKKYYAPCEVIGEGVFSNEKQIRFFIEGKPQDFYVDKNSLKQIEDKLYSQVTPVQTPNDGLVRVLVQSLQNFDGVWAEVAEKELRLI